MAADALGQMKFEKPCDWQRVRMSTPRTASNEGEVFQNVVQGLQASDSRACMETTKPKCTGPGNLVCMLTSSPDDFQASLNLEITEVRNRQRKNIPEGNWEGRGEKRK